MKKTNHKLKSINKRELTSTLSDLLAQRYGDEPAYIVDGPNGVSLVIDGQVFHIQVRKIQESRYSKAQNKETRDDER